VYRESTINSIKENKKSLVFLSLSIFLVGLWGYLSEVGFYWYTDAVILLMAAVVVLQVALMVFSNIIGLIFSIFTDPIKAMSRSLKYICRFFTTVFFIFGVIAFLDGFGVYPFLDAFGI